MSLGLPLVTARDGGMVEQVEDGVNGFLVSENEPREMAHRVRTLLTNPDMRRRFGQASKRIANETFSMERMVERYATLLNLAPSDRPREVRIHPNNRGLRRPDVTEGASPCIS